MNDTADRWIVAPAHGAAAAALPVIDAADLFEQAPVAYLVLDDQGSVRLANAAAAALFDRASAALLGQPFAALVAAAGQAQFRLLWSRLRAGERCPPCDLPLLRGAGQGCWARLNANRGLDHAGQPWVRLLLDECTGRREAWRVLGEREHRLSILTANSPAVLYSCMPSGRYAATFVSENVQAQLGYRAVEFVEDPGFWIDRVHPEDIEMVLAGLARFPQVESVEHEYRFRHRDSSWRWMHDRVRQLRDASGQPALLIGSMLDITTRKLAETSLHEAEAALRASAQRFRTIFAANPECVKLVGPQGQLLEMNRAGLAMLEADSVEQVNACGLLSFLLPQYRTRFAALHEQVIQGGSGVTVFEVLGLRGTRRWLETHATALPDDSGANLLLAVTRDVTEAYRVREAQRITELALKVVSQGVIIAGPDRCILSANDAFLAITGYSEAEILGRTCKFLQGSGSSPTTIAAIRRALDAGQQFSGEILNYRRDGSAFWNELTITPVLDGGGGPTHYIGVTRDVTGRRQAEQELRESELQMRLALRGGDLGLWDWNAGSGHLVVNERWLEMLGLAPRSSPLSIDDWHARVHPEDMPKLQRLVEEVILHPQGRNVDVEIRARHADGRWIWIQDMGIVVERDAAGLPLRVIGTHMDITVRKQAEAALQASLSEKVALLNEVHHRVKNNLQVITSLLRLEIGRSTQPATRAVLDDMKGRIRSMALLHESLYRSSNFASIDLGDYIRQLATQAFRSQAAQGGLVRLQLRLASVQVDLDQAIPCGLLVNELISNCLKHAFPDGRGGVVQILLQALPDSPLLQLRVSDSGIGLPADFEARRSQSLGLQLVFDLARQLGGSLLPESGPGTAFTVSFAAGRAAAPAVA